MYINVTKHAVKRYRERLFDYKSSEEKIKDLLKEVASKGKQIDWRPSTWGNCIEVKYRGISIVLVNDRDRKTIITCLGELGYRKWVKRQDHIRIKGRILYPHNLLGGGV